MVSTETTTANEKGHDCGPVTCSQLHRPGTSTQTIKEVEATDMDIGAI